MELRPLVWFAVALAVAVAQTPLFPSPALSQTMAPQTLAQFLTGALSVATLQARASEMILTRDATPEVKGFAENVLSFRRNHIAQIESLANERGVKVASEPTFEQRVILQNLEPLNFLALSRRYAEMQVEGLEFELLTYEKTAAVADAALKGFAAEWQPQLAQQLGDARKMLDASRR